MPSKTPRVFISFASEDEDARLELGRELKRHGIDTYDYSVPHLGSQVGMALQDQIAEEIDRADLVISLISDASTSPMKTVVHEEVARAAARENVSAGRHFIGVVLRAPRSSGTSRSPHYHFCLDLSRLPDLTAGSHGTKLSVVKRAGANWSHAPCATTLEVQIEGIELPSSEFVIFVCDGCIFFPEVTWKKLLVVTPPFVAEMLRGASRRTWMGAFATLQKRAWTHVDRVGPNCFNQVGRLVCERFGLPFQRPAPNDVRLPFYEKLHGEIWDLPNHIREALLGQLDFFTAWVPAGGWDEALTNVAALRALLRLHGRDSLYARIIQAVCLLRLERPSRALDLMEEVLDGRQAIDENVWGVRAKALYALGRCREALESSRQAVGLCEAKGDPAPHARIEWMTLALECQSRGPEISKQLQMELDLAFQAAGQLFDHTFPALGWEEDVKRWKVRAKHLWSIGRHGEAIQLMQELVSRPWLRAIHIPPEIQSGLPHEVGKTLLNWLADHGIFLDSCREQAVIPPGIRCHIREDGWVLVEEDRCYRLVIQSVDRFALYYNDLDIVTCLHLWRWEHLAPSATDQQLQEWLLELEKWLELSPQAGLFHQLIFNLCETGNLQSALRLTELAVSLFPEDPQLLQDASFIYHKMGRPELGIKRLKCSTKAALRQILNSKVESRFQVVELLEITAANFMSNGSFAEAQFITNLLQLDDYDN